MTFISPSITLCIWGNCILGWNGLELVRVPQEVGLIIIVKKTPQTLNYMKGKGLVYKDRPITKDTAQSSEWWEWDDYLLVSCLPKVKAYLCCLILCEGTVAGLQSVLSLLAVFCI